MVDRIMLVPNLSYTVLVLNYSITHTQLIPTEAQLGTETQLIPIVLKFS